MKSPRRTDYTHSKSVFNSNSYLQFLVDFQTGKLIEKIRQLEFDEKSACADLYESFLKYRESSSERRKMTGFSDWLINQATEEDRENFKKVFRYYTSDTQSTQKRHG